MPGLSARLDSTVATSTIARLIASGAASSKADLTRATALPRSTVSGSVDTLLDAGLVDIVGSRSSPGRGRPADVLALSARFGVVLLADVGVDNARLTVSDLGQRSIAETTLPLNIADGPEVIIPTVTGALDQLLMQVPAAIPRAVVVGLPGPVDPGHGRPVRPPIMPGWDDYPVTEAFGDHFDCDTMLENDVNLCALGEARALPPGQSPLLFVTIATGIGGGLVTADGQLHHGADGAAGDIGHIRVPHADDVICVCGNVGCIEAVASAAAIARRFAGLSNADQAPTIGELTDIIQQGNATGSRLIREAARTLGEVVAMLVHCFNPARVVLGGAITTASDTLLAGVRSVVYQRALPLATRNLVLAHSALGTRAGTAGATVLAIEHAISPRGLIAAGIGSTARG